MPAESVEYASAVVKEDMMMVEGESVRLADAQVEQKLFRRAMAT